MKTQASVKKDLVKATKNSTPLSIKKGKQGFASMSKEAQREIAASGGRAAHKKGTAHKWNSQEAAAAGRKGGRS